jgi:hypothetical protein
MARVVQKDLDTQRGAKRSAIKYAKSELLAIETVEIACTIDRYGHSQQDKIIDRKAKYF